MTADLAVNPQAAQKIPSGDLVLIREFRQTLAKNPTALMEILASNALFHVLETLDFNELFKTFKLKDSTEVMLKVANDGSPEVAAFVQKVLGHGSNATADQDESDKLETIAYFLEDPFFSFELADCKIKALTEEAGHESQ